MSVLDVGAMVVAWGVLLRVIGARELRKVLDDFYESLHRDCAPEPKATDSFGRRVIRCESRTRSGATLIVATPVVAGPVPVPTDEELERWINAPSAPEPRQR